MWIGIYVLLVVLLIGLIRRAMLIRRFSVSRTRRVISRVDGQAYRVHGNETDAADVMAMTNRQLIGILRYLRGVKASRRMSQFERKLISNVLTRYNPDNLAENSPHDPSKDTSYTINKGTLLAMCIRSRDAASQLHDLDTITFVAIHELAHVASDSYTHDPEFWSIFKYLLISAEKAGVYVSPDYRSHPVMYCGISINYNPRWDPAVVPR